MPFYAGYCTKCGKVGFTDWGNKTCPACGQRTLVQSRIEMNAYNVMPEAEKIRLFKDYYPEGTSLNDRLRQIEEERATAEEQRQREIERIRDERLKLIQKAKSVVVTTADLHEDYEIIGPVFFQVNDAGTGSTFRKLVAQYQSELNEWKSIGQGSADQMSGLEVLGALVNVGAVLFGGVQDRDLMGNAHANFDTAFFIATQELKMRAASMGGDAIVGMRQDIDLDTTGFQHFYLQMYGTAVKRKNRFEETEALPDL